MGWKESILGKIMKMKILSNFRKKRVHLWLLKTIEVSQNEKKRLNKKSWEIFKEKEIEGKYIGAVTSNIEMN